jgi:hypothetical protein
MPYSDKDKQRRAQRASEKRRRARLRLRPVLPNGGSPPEPTEPPALRSVEDLLLALEGAAVLALESGSDGLSVARVLVVLVGTAGRLLIAHETEQRLAAIETHLGMV